MKYNFIYNQKEYRCLIENNWVITEYYIQEQYLIFGFKFYRKIYKYSTPNLPGPLFMDYEKWFLEFDNNQRQMIFDKMIESFKEMKRFK